MQVKQRKYYVCCYKKEIYPFNYAKLQQFS